MGLMSSITPAILKTFMPKTNFDNKFLPLKLEFKKAREVNYKCCL